MNDIELTGKVHSAVYHQCKTRGYAAPVDVLMEIRIIRGLAVWRVDYLERICVVSLRRLLFILRLIKDSSKKERYPYNVARRYVV